MAGRKRLSGNILILAGVIVVLVAGFLTIREQIRRQETLARLGATPIPATATQVETFTPAPTATGTHTLTPIPPPDTATPTLPPTETPAPSSTVSLPPSPTFTPEPPTATPMPPTATPAPPTATPQPTATFTPTVAPAKIVRMRAPAIDLDTTVVDVGWVLVEQNGTMASVWETASYAAGHHINSALPGQGGNIVLSGHHNIEGKVFRYVVDLEVGDEIVLENELGQSFVYRVIETMILPDAGVSDEQRRANAAYIAATDEERLTLVTCWPQWTNTHRVIVIARPAP
jgi:sortase A